MKTVVGTIVNEQMAIIGLSIEAPGQELGNIDNRITVSDMTIDTLSRIKFSNRQVEVVNMTIKQKNGTKLKELPCKMYKRAENILVPFDNSITLKSRITSNGKLEGYEVLVAGELKRLRVDAIINLSNVMKCTNFVTCYTSAGKAYLAGRTGESLEKLPVIDISGADVKKVKAQQAHTASKNVVNADVKKNIDMIELMKLVGSVGGKILFLPTETYKKEILTNKKVAKDFVKFGAGEIGSPRIRPAEKSLNVNSLFSTVGVVTAQLSVGPVTLYPYTQTTKSIFRNGKNKVGKFGIAIQGADCDKVVAALGSALVLEPLTTPMIIQPLKAFMQDTAGTVKFYTIDTSNIEALSEEHAKMCVMSNAKIRETVLELLAEKSIFAFVNGASKAANDRLKLTSPASARGKIYQPFANLSEADLKILEDIGINIYTGAYEKTEETDEKTTADAERIRKLALGEDVVEKEAGWEVEYIIDKCSKSLSFKEIAENKNSALYDKVPTLKARLDSVVAELEKASNDQEIHDIAEPLKEACEKRKSLLVEKLWLNNMARLRLGNYESLVLSGFEEVKALKGSIAYRCNEPGIEDLGVKVTKSLRVVNK